MYPEYTCLSPPFIFKDMTSVSNPLFSPHVIGLLPLFYMGWSDSVLSPSEMALIHKRISSLPFLTPAEQDYLIQHTDPQNPPSESTFKTWLEILRIEAAKLPPGSKQTLSELGLDLAKSSSFGSEIALDGAVLGQALLEMEKELGIYTEEDLQSMLHQLDVPHLKAISKPASFQPDAMLRILDGQRSNIKHKTRQLLKDPFFSPAPVRDKETHRQQTLEMTRALAQQGLGSLAYPKNLGGQSDMAEYIGVFQVLANHDLSLTIKFGVQFGLFGGAILHLGTEKHHRKYLEPTGTTDLLGCFAMTETGHGSNVKDLETTATYDHTSRSIIVHTPHRGAGKEYIGNALHGSLAVVFAQLLVNGETHGIHAVLVPYRDASGALLPGIEVADCGYKMGLNGVDNGRFWFNQVKVPVENLLNRYGNINEKGAYSSPLENPNRRFFTMLGALVGGRICVGLAGISAANTALVIAVKYALKRRQFAPKEGEPETLLMDYPTHQHRLIPLIVRSYVFQFALRNLGEQYVVSEEADMRKIETKAAGLKALATWHATQTIQTCREACGGKGYLRENNLADLKADSDIFTTFEGDNTVLLQLVAKGLLTEFKESFHEEGFMAVIRYLGGKINQTLTTYNTYFTGNTTVEHLLEADFHADALRYREKKMLISLSDRMRDYLKKRLRPHEAFLKCQMHMIVLAKAYIERLAYREMIKSIAPLPDSPEKAMLTKIATYYALHCIESDKGWYLETEYMNGDKSKAIRRVLHKLTQELRPECLALVESFGIGESSLRAEIVA